MPNKDLERELNHKIQDSNLQFVVLLTLIIERIEFLEENGYIFGSVKSFLKNGKKKFEDFINKVFKYQGSVEGNDATQATNKLLVMQERVEYALVNQYVLTVDERRQRASEILSKYMIAPMVEKAMEEMEFKNLFNF
jgi:hypothetical protein